MGLYLSRISSDDGYAYAKYILEKYPEIDAIFAVAEYACNRCHQIF